jgi:DNA excision repair protein ERCC-2
MTDWPDGFKPREWQGKTLQVVKEFISQNRPVALEVPTGSGKTPFAMQIAKEFGGQALYLTHTKDQFTRIWEDNRKWFNMPLIYLMGKSTLCARPELWDKDFDEDADPDEIKDPCDICILRKLQKEIDCNNIEPPDLFVFENVKRAQEGYRNDLLNGRIQKDGPARVDETLSPDVPEESFEGYCPYYSVRSSMHKAKLVLGTLNYAINPSIRKNVFESVESSSVGGITVANSDYYAADGTVRVLNNTGGGFSKRFRLIIIDEAHNLDSAIENLGRKLSMDTISKAFKSLFGETQILSEEKAKSLEDKPGAEGVSVFLWNLYQSIQKVKIRQDDHLKRIELDSYLRSSYEKAENALKNLSKLERETEDGKLQYPKLASVLNFMTQYIERGENSDYGVYIETYKRKDGTESGRFRIMYFDHSSYLTFLKSTRVLFLSATMPSREHVRAIWGLPDTVHIDPVQSGFIGHNGRKQFHIVSGLSTLGLYRASEKEKFDEVSKYVKEVIKIVYKAEKSVLVAFTNGRIRKIFHEISQKDESLRPLVLLPSGRMKANHVRSQLERGKRIVLAVQRDSLLEGVEFLDSTRKNLLSDVVIAGVPLPPNDDYRMDLSDFISKTDAGRYLTKNDILYNEPALSAVKQAIGRATRSPEDSINVWLLDKRFKWQFWQNNLWDREV